MELLLTHGSYAVLMSALVLAGLGVPISEDIVLLAAGVLLQRGVTSLPGTAIVVATGVLGGDLLIFLGARRLGPAALSRPLFARLLPPQRRARVERLFARYGGRVIFVGRHLAGLRAAVFAMAGIHQMSVVRFVVWDAFALCVTGPIVVALGYYFSDRVDLVRRDLARLEHWALLVGVGAFAVWAVIVARPRREAGAAERSKKRPIE